MYLAYFALALAGSISPAMQTFCNPINIDYGYCPIPNFTAQGRHRATADPVILMFKGDYYLFSTNQWGYWWSPDMSSWTFVPRKFLRPEHKVYDELCAPAAWVMDGALHVIGSTYSSEFPIWKSTNPKDPRSWVEAIHKFKPGGWDPAYFVDDDGRLYLYHGSSNTLPIYGWEIDRKTFQPFGEHPELIRLHDDIHGWERFGEMNDNTFLRPFMEGAWMTKHKGRYYLQYGAPGTEFSGYADGVYVSVKPLGPFEYQAHNPFSFKPGGFARGAGHGATFQDPKGKWWHVSTIAIGVKNNFERRNGIWPLAFDIDGIMHCDMAYGDYPYYLPGHPKAGQNPGWMILNYSKPVQASSSLIAHPPNLAVDEDIKTYWSAKTNRPDEWLISDLGVVSTIHAIQVNYADQDATILGKVGGLYHMYRISGSNDGRRWKLLVDRTKDRRDTPHDYVELPKAVQARFVKIENVHMANGKFALSGLRIFGFGPGKKPAAVKDFVVLRGDSERRNAWIKWRQSDDATGYVIRCGIAREKMYTSIMVYGSNEHYFRAMDRDRTYWFQIEAFNEAGISARTKPILVE
jgi:xylan 1,4-beta-xylosidase